MWQIRFWEILRETNILGMVKGSGVFFFGQIQENCQVFSMHRDLLGQVLSIILLDKPNAGFPKVICNP